jgi:ankyrin repeat protein
MLPLLFDYMLFDDFNRPQFETENELYQFVTAQHPFYPYATVSWIDYIPWIDVSRPETLKALLRFIQSSNDCHKLGYQTSLTPFGRFGRYDPIDHPLRILCQHGINPVVAEHLPPLQLPAALIQCCLFASMWNGHVRLMESLLDFSVADIHREHRCPHEDHPPHSSAPRDPLTIAFDTGNLSMVRSLIKRGANPSHVLTDGWTMLHSATTCGRLEAEQMVLEDPSFKVDVHARHWSGVTAYMIAVQMEAKEIVSYLENHGASEDLDLSDDTPHGIGEKEVFQVGLCLAQMLRAEFKIVPLILDLAEYWAMSSARRGTPEGIVYDQHSPDEPYIALKIGGRSKAPLRRLVFTTTSHDQGMLREFCLNQ